MSYVSNIVPKGWNAAPISEICNIAIGGTPSRSVSEYWDSAKTTGSLWVSIRDLSTPWVYETSEYITELGIKNSNVKLVKKGTVLMSFKLSVGRVAFAGRDLYTNEAIVAFLPKDKGLLSNQFLYQGLQQWNLLENIDQAVKGITLNKEKINQIEALLPPLSEQQKIATILSSVDDVIEKTRAQIDKLKDLKTGMMQELLTKGIGHTEFKDSPVGRIPISWKVVELGVFCNIQNGYAFKSEDFASAGIPLIRISNIKNDQVSVKNDIYINNTTIPDRFCASFGDSLIAMSGATTGKTGCYRGRQKVYINQRVGKFVANKNLATNAWIRHIVRSNKFLDAVLIDAVGGAQPNISSSQLEAIICALPPVAEQAQIADILDSIDLKHDVEISKLSELVNLKKALMQDLLTGKVRVNLTDKESAVV